MQRFLRSFLSPSHPFGIFATASAQAPGPQGTKRPHPQLVRLPNCLRRRPHCQSHPLHRSPLSLHLPSRLPRSFGSNPTTLSLTFRKMSFAASIKARLSSGQYESFQFNVNGKEETVILALSSVRQTLRIPASVRPESLLFLPVFEMIWSIFTPATSSGSEAC